MTLKVHFSGKMQTKITKDISSHQQNDLYQKTRNNNWRHKYNQNQKRCYRGTWVRNLGFTGSVGECKFTELIHRNTIEFENTDCGKSITVMGKQLDYMSKTQLSITL